MKNALDYTDGNTVAERAYGREQDRLMQAYEYADLRFLRLLAEEHACDDLMATVDKPSALQITMLEGPWRAILRIAAYHVHADILPVRYADNLYSEDAQAVKDVIDEFLDDRTESLRQGESY